MSYFEIRARSDGGKYGGSLIGVVGKGLICKRLRKYVSSNVEVACSELMVSNKNWVISIYRPPNNSNILAFFKEPGKYLIQTCENYGNVIVMGAFNIDIR